LSDYKDGDHLQVKLSGGRIVEATIKAIVDTTRWCAPASLIRRRNGANMPVADC
jgi:hypothetical protein